MAHLLPRTHTQTNHGAPAAHRDYRIRSIRTYLLLCSSLSGIACGARTSLITLPGPNKLYDEKMTHSRQAPLAKSKIKRRDSSLGTEHADDKIAAVPDTYAVPSLTLFRYLTTGCQSLCFSASIYLKCFFAFAIWFHYQGNRVLPFAKENAAGRRRVSM